MASPLLPFLSLFPILPPLLLLLVVVLLLVQMLLLPLLCLFLFHGARSRSQPPPYLRVRWPPRVAPRPLLPPSAPRARSGPKRTRGRS
jgi:hypothetical protein